MGRCWLLGVHDSERDAVVFGVGVGMQQIWQMGNSS